MASRRSIAHYFVRPRTRQSENERSNDYEEEEIVDDPGIPDPRTDNVEENEVSRVDELDPPVEKKKKRVNCSKVWKYFTKNPTKKNATCTICSKTYSTSGNTSNLLDHLNRSHKKEFTSVSSDSSGSDIDTVNDEGKERANSGPVKVKQASIRALLKRKNLYKPSNAKRQAFDEQLAKALAVQYLPFTLTENEEFIKFCNMLDGRYIVPSRKALSDVLIPNLGDKIQRKLIKILEGVDVSLTTDCWTSPVVKSYLTLTCHFIYKNKLKKVVLDTPHVEASHTTENLKGIIESILAKYSIKNENVVSLTTDNAAAMVNLGSALSIPHLGCYAHKLNLVVHDCLWPSSAQKQKSPDFYEGLEPIFRIIDQVKKLVTLFHTSTLAAVSLKEALKDDEKEIRTLIQDVKTRWNSTYNMLKRFEEISSNVSIAHLLSINTDLLAPNYSDMQIVRDIIKVLVPFLEATEKISGSSYVTSSLCIPLTTGILTRLERLQDSDLKSAAGIHLRNALLGRAKVRLLPYETEKLCGIATLLDPRFKNFAFYNDANVTQHIMALQHIIRKNRPVENESVGGSVQVCNDEEVNTNASIFNFNQRRKSQRPRETDSGLANILSEYLNESLLSESCDTIAFWCETDRNPILSKVAKRQLIVPGSSVSSEQVFSSTGLLIRDHRSNLCDAKINEMTFIKNNLWLTE